MDIAFILLLLFFISFVSLLVGLIKPNLMIWWRKKEKRTRQGVLKVYLPPTLVFLVLFGLGIASGDMDNIFGQGGGVEELGSRTLDLAEANTQTPLSIETPDQSGQSTHPDMLYVEKGWNGYSYWMAHTPYTDSNEKLENPSLSYSTDGLTFKTLPGGKNPIDSPVDGLNTDGHMSDTDMVLKDGQIEIYYRYRYRPKGEKIFRKTSHDGINWSERELVMEVESTVGDDLLSPALVYEEGLYKMWWVGQEGVIYLSTSKSGLVDTWSPKKAVELSYLGKELRPWHLDVFKEKNKHYLVLNSYNGIEKERGRILAIGESSDGGQSFENIQKIIKPTEDQWDNYDVYRGSIIRVDDVYKLYYSGMHEDGSWGIGLTESKDLINWQGVHVE